MTMLTGVGEPLGEDLCALVAMVQKPLAEVTSLSGPGYPGYRPTAFRLRFADGVVLKGRRFGSVTRAETVEYISQHLGHERFPKVIARSGRALLTEWIEGRPLGGVDPGLLEGGGALHGFVHNVPVPDGSPYLSRETMADRLARLKRHLSQMTAAGTLEPGESQRALELAVRHAPGDCAVGFVHGDFCAENMVRRPSGDVCVVDNEQLAVDAYDYDLARTWYRWPMDRVQRQAYLEGYHHFRNSDDFVTHFPYWGIAVLVEGALFRSRIRPDAAGVPVTRFRVLLRDLEAGLSAGAALFESGSGDAGG